VRSFALVVVLGAAWKSHPQDIKTSYPSMASLDQYLMERNAEIALARSAAPEAISRDADVLILGRHGYETAVKGKNGFVCVVERGWMSPFDGDVAANFWNPKIRGPVCFNPPAARSILPMTYTKNTHLSVFVTVYLFTSTKCVHEYESMVGGEGRTMENIKFVVKVNRTGVRAEYVQRIDRTPIQMTSNRKLALVMGKFTAEDAAKSIQSSRSITELVSVPVSA